MEFTEEEIQSFSEANFKRELTDVELNRISEYWYECEDMLWLRTDILTPVIQMAMDNKSTNWKKVDKEYLDKRKGI
jgi:hypothetical protein